MTEQEAIWRAHIRFLQDTNRHLSYLVGFTRQANELDQIASTNPEFRGAQDAGWNTYQTAVEVASELKHLLGTGQLMSKAQTRQVFSLYAQLSEAGGFYETLSNMIGILAQREYTGWPFHELVRVRQNPRRVIGPNANAVFRDLASSAEKVGMTGLSVVLENAFSDELRNAISHSDYVFGPDGIRLRRRNGGYPAVMPYQQFLALVARGLSFFDLVQQHWGAIVRSFDPPRSLIGRFSANPPMRYEVSWDPRAQSFSISTSSVSFARSPEYDRQERINSALGGDAIALFTDQESDETRRIEGALLEHGMALALTQVPDLSALREEADRNGLWDERFGEREAGTLIATPFGFLPISTTFTSFTDILPAVAPLDIVMRPTEHRQNGAGWSHKIGERLRRTRPKKR